MSKHRSSECKSRTKRKGSDLGWDRRKSQVVIWTSKRTVLEKNSRVLVFSTIFNRVCRNMRVLSLVCFHGLFFFLLNSMKETRCTWTGPRGITQTEYLNIESWETLTDNSLPTHSLSIVCPPHRSSKDTRWFYSDTGVKTGTVRNKVYTNFPKCNTLNTFRWVNSLFSVILTLCRSPFSLFDNIMNTFIR